MSRLEETRRAMQRAEERYEQAASRKARVEAAYQEAEAEYNAARMAYTDALELELIRRAPDSLPSQTPEGGEDLEPGLDFAQVVRDAGSYHSEKRLVAQRMLEKMGPKVVPHLLRLMEREGHRRDKRLNVIAGVALCFTGTAVLELFFPLLAEAGVFLNSAMLLSIFAIFPLRRPTSLHRLAGEALTKNKDLRVIGPLIEALEMDDPYINRGAVSALIDMLPRLRASDTGLLTPKQMEGLCSTLNRREPRLILAALKALEQIGDSRALPHVDRLAEQAAYTSEELEIQREARACRSMLVDRKISSRAGETLLRASSAPEPSEETLLRPAQSSTTDPPEILLRATIGDNPT